MSSDFTMQKGKLDRILGFKETVALVIGSVIGSGIFMKPSLMAAELHSPFILLLVWLIAGLITMCGAVSNAEVASMYPETGGQLVFFEKMYGKWFAYMYGWSSFSVFNTAGNASIAFVCAQYLNYFFKWGQLDTSLIQQFTVHVPAIGEFRFLEDFGLKICTVLLLISISGINMISTLQSAKLQNLLSSLKLLAILVLIFGSFGNGNGSLNHFQSDANSEPVSLAAYLMAITAAFWAYDGWNNLSFVAGEVKNPQKNIPKGLIIGLSICTLVYILTNAAFLYVLGLKDLAASAYVASDAAVRIWGIAGGILISLMIILSTLGTVNSNVLSTARVTYALGTSNRIFRNAGVIHSRFKTPMNALLFNLFWSILLVFSGSFDMLTDMLIFISWFFYGMSALGVMVLRYKIPDAIRPYKVWLYPYTTIVFVVFSFSFLVCTLYYDIHDYISGSSHLVKSLLGLAICLAGLPFYDWRNNKDPKS